MVEKGYFDKDGTPSDKTRTVPEGVDPRLDNRAGDDRPPFEKDPAVPQQVDGPDLMHQDEHAEAVEKIRKATFQEGKGMFSPGDHSLGDEEARKGNDAGQADDRLETDPGSLDSAPTDASRGVGGASDALETTSSEPGSTRSRTTPKDK
jgi:hypothetical protein